MRGWEGREGHHEEEGGIKMWRSSEYNYLSPEKDSGPVRESSHVSICECIFIGLSVKGRKATQRGMGISSWRAGGIAPSYGALINYR